MFEKSTLKKIYTLGRGSWKGIATCEAMRYSSCEDHTNALAYVPLYNSDRNRLYLWVNIQLYFSVSFSQVCT